MKKSPLTKLQIGLLTACALLICIPLYLISRPPDKDTLIHQVEIAFKQQNSETLSKVLTSSDQNLQIDEKDTKALINYLHENPEYLESLITILQEQSNYYDEEAGVAASNSKTTEKIEGFLTLKKNQNFILPDTYSIEIDPVYLTVCTNMQDAVIKINGQKVTNTTQKDCDKKVGPLLPGEYMVEATSKQKDKEIKKTETVTLWNTDQEITLDLQDEDITLQTNKDKK